MTTSAGTQADNMDALVIFGATGDLAKLETFPALVGLVDRGVHRVELHMGSMVTKVAFTTREVGRVADGPRLTACSSLASPRATGSARSSPGGSPSPATSAAAARPRT